MHPSLIYMLMPIAVSASTGAVIASTMTETSTHTSVIAVPISSSMPRVMPRNYSSCTTPSLATVSIDLTKSRELLPLITANWTEGCVKIRESIEKATEEGWPSEFLHASFWPYAQLEWCTLELKVESPVALSKAHLLQIMSAGLGMSDSTENRGAYGMIVCSQVDDENSSVDVEWRMIPLLKGDGAI